MTGNTTVGRYRMSDGFSRRIMTTHSCTAGNGFLYAVIKKAQSPGVNIVTITTIQRPY